MTGSPASQSTSVVVASLRDEELLHACLDALVPQCIRLGAELLVVRAGGSDIARLRTRWPTARFVAAPRDSTVPALRGLGLAAARGAVVALTEDHCVPAPNWLQRLVTATAHADVVGGAMDNAQARALDWGAFFSEYGFFTEACGKNSPPLLTGANVAYGRTVLPDVAAMARQGLWENVIHDHLAATGRTLAFEPRATVRQNQRYRFSAFWADRFVHGRDYARARLVHAPRLHQRWWRILSTPVLPIVLAARVARCRPAAHRTVFRRALPFTLAFLAAWSIGEAVGYLLGPRSSPGA